MSEDREERPRFCPFCGEPVGSFFGRFGDDRTVWCERCQDWFRAERPGEPDDADPPEGTGQ